MATETIPAAKSKLRAQLLERRRSRPAEDRELTGRAIARHGLTAWSRLECVAAYASFGTEPPTTELIDGLRAAGVRVLLPVIDDDLDWAEYDGNLTPGPTGIVEPLGPRLGATALAKADVVAVAALAIDKTGHRLGRGRGHYDRALVHARSRIVAVVYDDELVDELPFEPHDRNVQGVLTPSDLTFF